MHYWDLFSTNFFSVGHLKFRSSIQSFAIFDHGTSGGKNQQEGNGVYNKDERPTPVRLRYNRLHHTN